MSPAIAEVISIPVQSIGKDIQTFIRSQESQHTQKGYERAIRYFFKYMRNKDFETVTNQDMLFRNADILEYKNHLADKFDSASSANAYLSAVFSMYKQLEKDYSQIEYKTIKVDFFKNNADPHGKITLQEAETMSLLAKEEDVFGHEKYCLIRLAYTTSVRKSALLEIKFSDITKHPEHDTYVIKGVDKGEKRFEKHISKELYDELLKIKEIENYKQHSDNKVFHLSNSTIQVMMNRLKNKMGISPERNVTFHSLRSVGAIYAVRVLGDVKRAQKELGHADVKLTMNKYVDDSDDYLNAPSLLMEQKIDNEIFDGLSREELIRLIKSQSVGAVTVMKETAQKIIQSRR